jgi:hypothetical protein
MLDDPQSKKEKRT